MAVVLSFMVVIYGIALDYNLGNFGGPSIEFILFLFSLTLLAANEGFQVAVLHSQHIAAEDIRTQGHHRAACVHELMFGTPAAPKVGRVKNLLMGQSFFVVVCSFTLANLTTFDGMPNFLGINDTTFRALVCSGLPGIIIVINVAQLTPSLLAKEYPLRCLNIPGIYSTIYAALALEHCGVVHFVYVLYGIINSTFFGPEVPVDEMPDLLSNHPYSSHGTSTHGSAAAGNDESNDDDNDDDEQGCVVAVEPAVAVAKSTAYFIKVAFSTLLTVLCVAFVIGSIGTGHSSVDISVGAAFVVSLLVLVIVTYCEGLKVAVVSTTHLRSDDLGDWPNAQRVHQLLNNDVKEGVKKFLIGRQLTVVPLGFVFAHLTHFVHMNRENFNSATYFLIVEAGLPGVLILLQFAQLTPQLLAEQNSIPFMNIPGNYLLSVWTLQLEKLGIVNFTWLFYGVIENLLCTKRKDGEEYQQPAARNPLTSCLQDDSGHGLLFDCSFRSGPEPESAQL
eukprot:CAMPEP_0114427034 /NCGR_PEP_ID=MMETSP0103-20121206/8126_1 /TAXON_ID=37642 ORGANISM="Paraphysomonas imperforata, Strain PA2" /NCGR_SAMPLE_ID=MMETSP0103 /ASSEMBLY_ACC=CAM_ASM_000201 /LENGTH=503 /DNA_ID=CAMNT_0001596055 /DNA_START=273 /DNA_END=1784 /DNA_ORIENTATION=+